MISMSTEEKALAFDKLCEILSGKGVYSHSENVPIVSTKSSRDVGDTVHRDMQYRTVQFYKFVLIASSSDIRSAAKELINKVQP